MKHLLLAIISSLFFATSNAQNKYPVYCEVMAYNFWGVGKVNITIDLGDEQIGAICDTNQKQVKFNSHIDAINHMAKLGWAVKETYFLSEQKDKVLHFLLVKYITDDKQKYDGIYIKPKNKKEKYTPGKNGDDMY